MLKLSYGGDDDCSSPATSGVLDAQHALQELELAVAPASNVHNIYESKRGHFFGSDIS